MSLPVGWALGDNGFWYNENGLGPYARSNLDTFHLVGGGDITGDDISGGGATSFTDLEDAPETITPSKVLIGNAAGTALIAANGQPGEPVDIFGGDDDEVGTGGQPVRIRGGNDISGGGAGYVEISGGSDSSEGGGAGFARVIGGPDSAGGSGGGRVDIIGGAAADGGGGAGNVNVLGGAGAEDLNGGDVIIRPGAVGSGSSSVGFVRLYYLPTSDPAETNALWNDSGTLKISAG